MAGALILAVLLARLGTGPFLEGLHATTAWSLCAATAATAAATWCSAWRWRVVARALGMELSAGAAVASYYRSQFLNSTLPGGVLGDVHRAVSHGRTAGQLGRSLRSVAWERSLGQAVQVTVTLLVVVPFSAPLRALVASVAGICLVVVVALIAVRPVLRELLRILAKPGDVAAVTAASIGMTGCHTAAFLVALKVAGVDLGVGDAVPLALVVLLASAVPTSVGGWGPREGAAAWAFGAVGLTAANGVTVSVVYGIMGLAATLPGAVVLLTGRRVVVTSPVVPRTLEEASRG